MSRVSKPCILVVDDDEPKRRSIVSVLAELFGKDVEIITAASVTSAIRALSSQSADLAVVDMSLPTFDFAVDRFGGGRPQGFGGADILRFIQSESPQTYSVVLTQYEEFPASTEGASRGVAELDSELRAELGSSFLGVVHYAGRLGEWRQDIAERILSIGLRGA